MANNNVIGIAMQMDVADLTTGIAKVNEEIKKANSIFKKETAGIDQWYRTTDGLTAKLKQLDAQITYNSKAIAGYEAEIQRVKSTTGNVADLDRLNKKLIATQTALNKAKHEFEKYSQTLENLKKANASLETPFAQLNKTIEEQQKQLDALTLDYKNAVLLYGENSQEVSDLSDKIKALNQSLSENKTRLDDVNNSAKNVTNSESKAGSAMQGNLKTIEFYKESIARLKDQYVSLRLNGYGKLNKKVIETRQEINFLTKVLDKNEKSISKLGSEYKSTIKKMSYTELQRVTSAVNGVIFKFSALIASITALSVKTQPLAKNLGKLNIAFKNSNVSATSAKKAYDELFSIVGDSDKVTEATSHLGKLVDNSTDLERWVSILTGVYATFGDSLPIENLAEASNETAKTGKIVSGLADALNWAGITEDEFEKKLNRLTSEEARTALITNTLVDVYGDMGKEYIANNEDVIKAQNATNKLNDALLNLSTQVRPIVTTLKTVTAQIATNLIPIVDKAISLIKDNAPLVITVLGTIGASFAIIIAKMTAMKALMIATTVATTLKTIALTALNGALLLVKGAMLAVNVVFAMNPFGLVTALVIALGVALVTLYNKCEWFRDGVNSIFAWLKDTAISLYHGVIDTFSNVKTFLSEWASSAIEGAKNLWSSVTTAFNTGFETVKTVLQNVGSTITDTFTNVIGIVKDKLASIKNLFENMWNSIVDFFSEHSLFDIGVNLIEGLWNGIKSVKDKVVDGVKDVGTSIIDKAKDVLGIHSPSTEFAEIGQYLMEGLSEGIEDNSDLAVDAVEDVATDIGNNQSFITKLVNGIKKLLAKANEKLKPIVDEVARALGIDLTTSIEDSLDEIEIVPDLNITFKDSIKEILSNFENLFDSIDKKTDDWVKSFGNAIGTIEEKVSKVVTRITDAWSALSDYQTQLNENRIKEIDDELEAIEDANTQIAEWEKERIQKQIDENELLYWKREINDDEYRKRNEALQKQLNALNNDANDAEKSIYQEEMDRIDSELKALQDSYKNKQIDAETYNKEKVKLEKKSNETIAKLQKSNSEREKSIRAERNELERKNFEAQKKNQIAQVWINFASATVRAFAENWWPVALGISASLATIAGAQTATINAQQYTPALAKGGITTGETLATIGEDGREAVLPLEKNTGWMETLAEKLNAIMLRDYSMGNNSYTENARSITNNYTQVINAPKSPSRRELYRDGKNLLALKGVN